MLEGRAVDSLPAMPITMMFAAGHIGAKYFDYATHYRVQTQAQIQVATHFAIDYVRAISDSDAAWSLLDFVPNIQ
jgi:hypothetical protein